jgi:hypothetical protein
MGQKYAAYDAQGAITGFYDDSVSPVPEGMAAIKIPDEQWQTCLSQPGWTVANGALVAPVPPTAAELLAQVQAAQGATLTQDCQEAIVGGFASGALGSTYTYPSTLTDQANQQAVSASADGGLLYCVNGAGEWALVQHTQPQAQQVVSDFVKWLNACQQQLVAFAAQVNAPNLTAAQVQAIAWVNPVQS